VENTLAINKNNTEASSVLYNVISLA